METTYRNKHDYKGRGTSQSYWYKSVNMMIWSGVRHNHADDDINKSENKKEMKEKRGGGLSL